MQNTLRVWDHETNLTNQLWETITPEEARRRYGAAAFAEKTIVEENPQGLLMSIDDADILCGIYDIDPTDMTDEELCAAIVYAKEHPPVPEPEVTQLDRIEAQLMYSAMLNDELIG